jgi:hypothetical protein
MAPAKHASVPIPKFAKLCGTHGASFGIEGHQQLYDSSAPLNPRRPSFIARVTSIMAACGKWPPLLHQAQLQHLGLERDVCGVSLCAWRLPSPAPQI